MRKILIADDEPHVLRVLKMSLEKEGYAVDVCANGMEAVAKLREEEPDILITDIQMPQMSGEELCKYITQTERFWRVGRSAGSCRSVWRVERSVRALEFHSDRTSRRLVREHLRERLHLLHGGAHWYRQAGEDPAERHRRDAQQRTV